MRSVLLIVCAIVALASAAVAPSPPTFPQQYFVQGTFSIPYFNITEPLELWYDAVNDRQVFNYYNGMDFYYTINQKNTTFAVTPAVDTLICAASQGYSPLISLFPDLSQWTYEGTSVVNGLVCDNWQSVVVNYNKTATYNFYISDGVPVQLYLNGVDFVFDSHPDIYILNYGLYIPNYLDETVFDEPELCQSGAREGRPGVGALGYAARVMGGLQGFYDVDVEEAPHAQYARQFAEFAARYGKSYATEEEQKRRFEIFRRNSMLIEQHNALGLSYKLGMNHFGDMDDAEFAAMMLLPKGRPADNGATATHELSLSAIPAEWDWREHGAVTAVKDQGVCGSCWTFGSAGSLEGVYAIATGTLLRLSEQQIVDCAWTNYGGPGGNQGCNGGYASGAFQFIMNNGGIATESSYPYLMQNGWCRASDQSSGVKVKGYVNVTAGENNLLDAVATAGPVAVAIDASAPDYRFYESGVYYSTVCGNSLDDLDHEVLAVGYGTFAGQDYWLVKNSWSTHWGNEGYIMMARNRNNNCGIASQPTYPIVA